LEEWVERKERENNEAPLTPDLIDNGYNFIQKDSYFQKLYETRLNKKIRKLLEKLFEAKYNDIQKEDLHLFAENILERLYLLKKHTPKNLKYLLKGVFHHPNLNSLDKSNLETALQWYKINTDIEDSPLLSVNAVEVDGERLIHDQKIANIKDFKEKLKAANLPIVDQIVNRLKNA